MTRSYDANGLAGCVQQTRSKQTGHLVGVYRNDQAGLDECAPWSTVCETHSHVIAHDTLALARWHAADPLGWCEGCMAEHNGEPDPYSDHYAEVG